MKKYLPNNLTAMKRIFGIVTIASFMVACNQQPQTGIQPATTTTVPLQDTVGLAQFQAWKSQNELQALNDQQNLGNNGTAQVQQQRSTNTVRTSSPARSTRSTSTARRSTGTSGNGTGSNGSTSTAQTQQKKGMSKAAKGAVIGGVTGGVAGAIINKKNRAVGGIVGAVIGAGGGYVIGKSQDKKDGRN